MENYAPYISEVMSPEARADHLHTIAHEVGSILLSNEIPFRVWSGTQAAELGGHRYSQDVDMWLPDWAIRPAHECLRRFTDHEISVQEEFDRTIVTVGENAEVELMANMDIYTIDGVFPFRLTGRVLYQDAPPATDKWSIPFAPPEDTMLLKAVLQRDASIGKHDGEDIQAMASNMQGIDEAYLLRRLQATKSIKRAVPFLRANGVTVDA